MNYSDSAAPHTYVVSTPEHGDTFVVTARSQPQAAAVAMDAAREVFDAETVEAWLEHGWPDDEAIAQVDGAPGAYLIDGDQTQ